MVLYAINKTMNTNMRHQLHMLLWYLSIEKYESQLMRRILVHRLHLTIRLLFLLFFFLSVANASRPRVLFFKWTTLCVKSKYSTNYYKSLRISFVVDIFHWKAIVGWGWPASIFSKCNLWKCEFYEISATRSKSYT